MSDRRTISDNVLVQESFLPGLKIMVDYLGFPEAKAMMLALLGNTYIQGSSNGIEWTDQINGTHTKFRISTDGGNLWKTLDTDFIPETVTNKYYTEARVSANTDVQANTLARHQHINKTVLDNLVNNGDGTNFLTDNGSYKYLNKLLLDKFSEQDGNLFWNEEIVQGDIDSNIDGGHAWDVYTFTQILDGGYANEDYSALFNVDGGNAQELYTTNQLIDGGTA